MTKTFESEPFLSSSSSIFFLPFRAKGFGRFVDEKYALFIFANSSVSACSVANDRKDYATELNICQKTISTLWKCALHLLCTQRERFTRLERERERERECVSEWVREKERERERERKRQRKSIKREEKRKRERERERERERKKRELNIEIEKEKELQKP